MCPSGPKLSLSANQSWILKSAAYDPATDIALSAEGCWRWNSPKPGMHRRVREYFNGLDEDEELPPTLQLNPAPHRLRGLGMDQQIISTFAASLLRCTAKPDFEERFYEIFLASSPKIAEKFAMTDFQKQKFALRASFHTMLLAASDGESGPEKHLGELAERHSRRQLDIGAELYDYWLDSLLTTVRQFDTEYGPDVEEAWEKVMGVGIQYLLSRY